MPAKLIFFKDSEETKAVLRNNFNIPESVEITDGLEHGDVIFIKVSGEEAKA